MSTPTALARSIEQARPDPYPYVVIRHMPAVYSRVSWDPPLAQLDADGVLTSAGRDALIEHVAGLVAKSQKRCCAVFGPDDAVYCEPDGRRWSNEPGAGVPDGYTHVQLAVPEPEPEPPRRSWRDHFAVADRKAGIWSLRGDVRPVFHSLEALGVPRTFSIGGSPGGRGDTDVSAWAFLDGGIHWATRDGFVCGSVYGVKVVGERAFVWCCRQLSVVPPRSCRPFPGLLPAIERQVREDGTLEERGDVLARARTWPQLLEVAARLAREFDPSDVAS